MVILEKYPGKCQCLYPTLLFLSSEIRWVEILLSFVGDPTGTEKIVQVSKPKLCQRMILREEEMKHRFPAN